LTSTEKNIQDFGG